MKISTKLICSYLAVALVMSMAGYLAINIYIDIKAKVVALTTDPVDGFGFSRDLIHALEGSQKSMQALIKNNPMIYTYPYSPSDMKRKAETKEQVEKRLNKDLNKIEHILSPLTNLTGLTELTRKDDRISEADRSLDSVKNQNMSSDRNLKDWQDLRNKHFLYHWKYLSHFINLADEQPERARHFFKKTLEPHYRRNIYPIINTYRKNEKREREKQVRKIIDEYIPNASTIIVASTSATLISVFFLGFWVYRSISAPLGKLTTAALKIGRGQLETRIHIKSKDEVGILADAFNRMINDLSKTTVSKSYVENIIRSMMDTLIVVNPDSTIIKVNKSTLNLLGYTRKELIGVPVGNIIFEEKTGKDSIIDELIYRGSIGNVEKTYLTKDNLKIPMLFSGAVMHDTNGKIQGIVCMARDIIDRKQTEIVLQKAYDEMEHTVDERTSELQKANKDLKREIIDRMQTEVALRESENRLRQLSSKILTAQEKARKRLSLELHDDLGQSLSLLKVQLSSIQRKMGSKQETNIEKVDEARAYLDLILENVRRLSKSLSPSILEDLGLSAALRWLIGDFTKHYDFKTDLNIENPDDYFTPETQIVIYRIFQEILTNIGRHANADLVTVNIHKYEGRVSFAVVDNGKGFDMADVSAKDATQKGIGLTAMQERALMLRSSLEIRTGIGTGTEVTFTIPIDEGIEKNG